MCKIPKNETAARGIKTRIITQSINDSTSSQPGIIIAARLARLRQLVCASGKLRDQADYGEVPGDVEKAKRLVYG